MENWAEKTTENLKSKLNNSREKDLRFFRVDEFIRNIRRVDEFSEKCPECNKFKTDINAISENIHAAINKPGRHRRDYDRLINRLAKHMKKKHGFVAPYYFSYLYSFYGSIAGVILGTVLYFIFPDYNWTAFALGLTPGLIVGYFRGAGKDNKIRRQKKIM